MRAASGRGLKAGAFLSLHLFAFAAAYAAGRPTLYAAFALVTGLAVAAAHRGSRFEVASAGLASSMLLLLGLPLMLFAARQEPSVVAEKALEPEVHRALYLAVYGPLLAAAVSLVLGVPLALMLSRGFPGVTLVESLVDLPLVVPHSVAGLLILFGFGEGGVLPGLSVLGTTVGMVLALVFVSAPFAVNASREAFESVDRRVEYAARVHGASDWETFRRVTFPLAWRGVLTGGVLAWARSVSEFGAVAVVAYSVSFFYPPAAAEVTGSHAPVLVYSTFISEGLAESGAVAFLLLLLTAGIFVVLRATAYGDDGGTGL